MEKRKNYIDIIKGISIVAIVLLHFENGFIPDVLNRWIGSFMIAAFYLTSGWLMGQSSKKLTVKELILKRIPTLVKPYLWFSLILLIFDGLLILFNYKEPKFLLIELYKTITLRGIGTLWFLPALLGGEIVFVFLIGKNIKYLLLGTAGTLLYMFVYWKWSVSFGSEGQMNRIIDAPLRTIQNVLGAWLVIAGGFYLSRWFREALEKISKIKLGLMSILINLLSFIIILNVSSFHPSFVYPVIVEPFLVKILCPFGILMIAILTERFFINKFFIFWGKNSLVLMATHLSILMEISIILNTYWTGSTDFIGINTVYFFIATMLIEYPIVYFINSRAKFLIGKQN